jgi:UDP-galactopyranose mutase
MIPFEKNESTKFISPTKTPEYLAAGKPVISTSIKDVVSPYGDKKLVYIADNTSEFIAAVECELAKSPAKVKEWLVRIDAFLANLSWDETTSKMLESIDDVMKEKRPVGQSGKLKSVA